MKRRAKRLPRDDGRLAPTAGLRHLRIVLRYALADVSRQLVGLRAVAVLPAADRWNGKRGVISAVRADTVDGYWCSFVAGGRRRWLSPDALILVGEQ